MINGSTFLSESIIYLRDTLRNNLVDPISRTGSGTSFVYTSYPKNNVQYPIVTLRNNSFNTQRRVGMSCNQTIVNLPVEIRVWARNEKEKDLLSQSVYHILSNNQIAAGSSSTTMGLFGFKLLSAVNVDEDGEEGIKSRVMEYTYNYITT